MLKRDSLTAQMQQLSQMLAKVKRLIVEDKESEAKTVTFDIFLDYYKLTDADLLLKSDEEFIQFLKEQAFVAEEIDMLAYFIDEYAGLQDELIPQITLYRKLVKIYDYLEHDLQFISLEHIARRKIIEQSALVTNDN